jgi:nitronate monooxygenase
MAGLSEIENGKLYRDELDRGDGGYGTDGRLTTYAGTGVGLIKKVTPAGDIVKSLHEEVSATLYGGGNLSRL